MKEVAKTLQISHVLAKRPGQLSGGEAQRVALGRCLIVSPVIFQMDEPLANIDAKLRLGLRTELKQLHKSLGKTFIYVTHDQEEALTMSDRIAVIHDGALQQVGTPDEIYRSPVNKFVADFFGNPPINFIEGEIEKVDDDLVFRAKGMDLTLDHVGKMKIEAVKRRNTMGVRPGDTLVSKEGEGFEAKVSLIQPRGIDKIIILDYRGESPLNTTVEDVFEVEVGDEVKFRFLKERLLFFDESGNRVLT